MVFVLPWTFLFVPGGSPGGGPFVDGVLTYLDMQNRIADELDRTDLTIQIKRAIVSAVAYYERKGFYFMEGAFTFPTVVGTEYYDAGDAQGITSSPQIDILNININQGRNELDKKSFEYIDSISYLPTSTGMPEMWAYRAGQIRLYPIPSQIWTITAFNVPRITMLSADTDANSWTNDAEALIRARAKMDLCANVIRGPDMADEMAAYMGQEKQELAALFSERASRSATGVLAPTDF
jgi:hypothetical protein